jgi:hypothetical protein
MFAYITCSRYSTLYLHLYLQDTRCTCTVLLRVRRLSSLLVACCCHCYRRRVAVAVDTLTRRITHHSANELSSDLSLSRSYVTNCLQ